MYDNDRDGAKAGTNTGVNIFLQWCQQDRDRYMDLAADIDRVIDGGDGYNRGSFRWDDPPSGTGNFILRVSTF